MTHCLRPAEKLALCCRLRSHDDWWTRNDLIMTLYSVSFHKCDIIDVEVAAWWGVNGFLTKFWCFCHGRVYTTRDCSCSLNMPNFSSYLWTLLDISVSRTSLLDSCYVQLLFNTQCHTHISHTSHVMISSLFNVRVSAPHNIPRKCFYNVLHCQTDTPRPKFSFLVKSFLRHSYSSFCLFYRPTSSVLWSWEPAGLGKGALVPLKIL